jgi:hypothetical protein
MCGVTSHRLSGIKRLPNEIESTWPERRELQRSVSPFEHLSGEFALPKLYETLKRPA